MTLEDMAQAHVTDLERVLVEEFQALQALIAFTREERHTLARADFGALLALLPRKQAVQLELGRLDAERAAALAAWARAAGLPAGADTLVDVLPHLEPAVAGRLGHVRQGILALSEELRDLNHGNRALASSALERVEAVRDFLLSLDQPADGYQPWGPAPARAGAVLTMEQWA